jgi:FtsH-binding integral membrane protein
MNNYLYNYPNKSQEYNKYQQPPYESYGTVPAGAALAIYEALALTAILTIGLGAWAWITKRNLSFLGPILFIGLLAVVVASIFSLFFATGPLSFIIACSTCSVAVTINNEIFSDSSQLPHSKTSSLCVML